MTNPFHTIIFDLEKIYTFKKWKYLINKKNILFLSEHELYKYLGSKEKINKELLNEFKISLLADYFELNYKMEFSFVESIEKIIKNLKISLPKTFSEKWYPIKNTSFFYERPKKNLMVKFAISKDEMVILKAKNCVKYVVRGEYKKNDLFKSQYNKLEKTFKGDLYISNTRLILFNENETPTLINCIDSIHWNSIRNITFLGEDLFLIQLNSENENFVLIYCKNNELLLKYVFLELKKTKFIKRLIIK